MGFAVMQVNPNLGESIMRQSNVKIIHNKLLGGWFIVRGPHQTPIGGRFDTKEQAQQHRDNVRAYYKGATSCKK
jgi:hypothetical protein